MDVARGSVDAVEQMGATGTRRFPFGPVHEAVQHQRVMGPEWLGHLHPFGHAAFSDALEHVIFGDFAAWRERPPFGGDDLDMRAQRYFVIQEAFRAVRYSVLSFGNRRCSISGSWIGDQSI